MRELCIYREITEYIFAPLCQHFLCDSATESVEQVRPQSCDGIYTATCAECAECTQMKNYSTLAHYLLYKGGTPDIFAKTLSCYLFLSMPAREWGIRVRNGRAKRRTDKISVFSRDKNF